MCSAILGSLGAEVILVEGPDGRGRRRRSHEPDGRSLEWWALRRGARSCVIHDRNELLELVAGADAVIESPDPGLGLDHDELRTINPGLVHTTITAFGSTGPKTDWAASDLTIAASACSAAITGDADRAPLRITAPQSWLHAGSHGAVYPCDPGDADPANPLEPPDPWVAIVCETEHHWESLCEVLEADGHAVPAELAGLDAPGRVARSDDIDAVVGAWAAARTPAETEAALQAAGIPAHANQNGLGCLVDPQLNHRGH